MKKHKKKEAVSLYKHSLGHYYLKNEAILERDKLEKKYPNGNFQVVWERRRRKWRKHWCLCQFVKPKKESTRKYRLSLPSA